MNRLGSWLFRHRGWLPVPLFVLALLPRAELRPAGLACLVVGEGIRLAAVGQIGRRSRTRAESVGDLVDVGLYARLRNPLYAGNLLLWAGVGVLAWPSALVIVPLLALHYALIVRWEESNLLEKLGAPYADYLQRVPRWLPTGPAREGSWSAAEAFRSERGTFAVLAIIAAALFARWYLST